MSKYEMYYQYLKELDKDPAQIAEEDAQMHAPQEEEEKKAAPEEEKKDTPN